MQIETGVALAVAGASLFLNILKDRYTVKRDEMTDMTKKVTDCEAKITQLEVSERECQQERLRLQTALTEKVIENNTLLREMQRGHKE
jgi:hypothetical protein